MARKMKDSGIEWIGEIPEGWSIARGKHILTLLQRAVFPTDGVITCFRDGEVTLRSNRREDGFTVSLKEIGYQGIEPGDLVVHGMDGFAGSIGISDSRGKSSPVLVVLDSSQDKKYLMYYLRSMAYNNVFLALSTGIRVRSCDLKWNKLADLLYLVPPIVEQHKLVSFLDEKCSEIDAMLSKTRASIEEYKKLKQAVITQAVTTLNCPNVKLKYLMDIIVDCPHETPIYTFTGNYLVIRTSDQSLASLRCDEDMYRLDEAEYKKRTRRLTLDKDDIVYGREGSWGLACLVPQSNKYCLGQRVMQFRCNTRLLYPKYAMYALNSETVYMQGALDTIGSTAPHVNISTICNYLLPVPALTEQKEITNYLDAKCAEIDRLIAKKEQLVKELESYKKSLIYEVVTGKREV